jgi:hypothetical protein
MQLERSPSRSIEPKQGKGGLLIQRVSESRGQLKLKKRQQVLEVQQNPQRRTGT